MKLSELYSEYIANWISDGLLINRDRISLIGIKPLFDRFLTNGWITKVWMITGLPVTYNSHITHKIREELFAMYPDVKTVIHMYSTPVPLNVQSENFKRHLKRAASRYTAYKEVFDNLSVDQKLTGAVERDSSGHKFSIDKETLLNIKDDYDSYSYVYEQVMNGRTFTNTYYFIQVSAQSRKRMKECRKALQDLLMRDRIRFKELRGSMDQYLDNFCPATYLKHVDGKFMSMLFSEENTAAFIPNKTRGLVSTQGLLIGLDWESKLPFFLDLFNSGTAQVVMLLGKSGCGKTYLAFLIAMELIGFNVHCSVTDIKGKEWSKLLTYVPNALIISMSGNNAKFVNTLRLDDIPCDETNCREFYDMAKTGTADIFEIATNLNENEGNVVDLRAILDTAINKLYSTHHVSRDNPTTFKNTKGLKFSDVLEVISTLEGTKSYTESQRIICRLVRVRCSNYFSPEGGMHDAFVNELTVSDILDSPLVIYEFNKNSDAVLSTLDSLRVYMSQFLDGKKHSIRKQSGLHTAAFYEELQRCGNLDKLVNGISANVTGSRSNNLSVFLLLNAVSTFDDSAFGAIKSNITTKIIGLCEKDDSRILVEHFGCKDIADYMDCIRDDTNTYSHCFATSFDTGNASDSLMLKSVIPEDMCKQFSTRDNLSYGGDSAV